MTITLNPDLFVSTSENIASHGARFPAAMQQELESVPGVAEVQPVRMVRMEFRGSPIMVVRRRLAAASAAVSSAT